MVKKLKEIIVLLKDIKRILGNIYMMCLSEMGKSEYYYYFDYPMDDGNDAGKVHYTTGGWTENE